MGISHKTKEKTKNRTLILIQYLMNHRI